MHITLTDQVKLFVFWIQMTLKVLTIAAYSKINTRKKKLALHEKLHYASLNNGKKWPMIEMNVNLYIIEWNVSPITILNRMIHQSNDTGWDDSQIKHNTHRTQVYN